MFTSGSTGKPKLHFQTLTSLKKGTKPSHKGKIWGLLYSPSRMAGLQVVLQSQVSNAIIVEADPATTTEEFLQECLGSGVNCLSATPSRWRALLSSETLTKLPLQNISIGGEIADQILLDKLKKTFPSAQIRHIYATTETGPVFSVSDCLEGFPANYLSRTLASGKSLSIVENELVVTDLNNGRPGEPQEIHTGDLVEVSEERVRFAGRIGDIVNVGGVKVSLTEIERLGCEIPGVADCQARQVPSPFVGSLISLQIQWEGLPLDNRQVRSYFSDRLPKAAIPAVISQVEKIELSDNFKKRRTF
jgi:acyl-CoA synthetase (AMP-forming)/AMP-acid ligase II